jgi:lipoyl synthase
MLERPYGHVFDPGRYLYQTVPVLLGGNGPPARRGSRGVDAGGPFPDGGASVFAETIRETRRLNPHCTIEVLIPDFEGNAEALGMVCTEKPEILNHNIETVKRLFPSIRPQGKYQRSIDLLARAKRQGMRTKSGLILGMGETFDEAREVMRDLRAVDCDIITIGQYLQPTREHLPVARFYDPSDFQSLKEEGLAMGFAHVESGPLVRSSYHAERQVSKKNV